jgi:hypothetical protein
MSQGVYADTEGYTTRWDDDLGAVVHKWNRYVDGDAFRAGCEAMIELAKQHEDPKILIDHREMKLVDQEDQEYIREDWIPRAVEAGAEYHVVIHQPSTIAEMNLDGVIDLDGIDYKAKMTADMDGGRQWLQSK